MKRLLLILILVFAVMSASDARMSGVMLIGAGTSVAPAGCTTEKQSKTGNVGYAAFGKYTNYHLAEQFTVGGTGYKLCKIEFHLYKVGSPTGNITAYIYSDDGEAVGSPDTLLATSTTTIDASTLTESAAYYAVSFGDYALSASTKYFIVVMSSGASETNYVRWVRSSWTSVPSYANELGTWGVNIEHEFGYKIYGN